MSASDPSSDDSMQNGGGAPAEAGAATATFEQQDFFGHPRGLSTLFFTELWERFSYYGMRALLVLFMTTAATAGNPGLGFDTGKATAVYGLYTFFVYVLSLPGGWVADNIWGQRRAVFVGGCIIAAGHFSMALPMFGLPEVAFFYFGLLLIVIGTGLLKPNVSTMVGDLYPDGGARRDAGFSIFYMGINFGAILGPTLCSLVGEGYNWHWGFSLAGFGMVLGLISYKLGAGYLGPVGLLDDDDEEAVARKSRNFYLISAAVAAACVLFGFLMSSGVIGLSLQQLAGGLGTVAVAIVLLFFVYLTLGTRWIAPTVLVIIGAFFFAAQWLDVTPFLEAVRTEVAENDLGWSAQRIQSQAWTELYIFAAQIAVGVSVIAFMVTKIIRLLMPSVTVSLKRKRLFVIFWLFILAALFWSGFEQAGSSLNLFAKNLTGRVFGPFSLISQTTVDLPFFFFSIPVSLLPLLLLGIPIVYVVYRLGQRENLWWVGTAGAAVFGLLIVGFFNYVFTELTAQWTMPASMLQNINPTFIVILAPVFGWLWTWLANRNANPSIPVKFALGLLGLAAGFFVLSWGAARATVENPVTPAWLVVTYFLHTCGELALSPVGLSSMTKLAPENRVGQMMGVWFVAAALGNLFAGLIAGQLETLAPTGLFWAVAMIVGGGGIVALLASPFVKRLMGDVE